MIKLNWITKACGVLLLWAAAATGLPAQTFTTLVNFDGTDGQYPYGVLAQGTDGNLYGTTGNGGSNENVSCTQNGTPGCGTVFKITPSGTLTTIYNFCSLSDCTDGAIPVAALVQGTDGDFYGTTLSGGASGSTGTFFKITSGGTLTTLHSFDNTDGTSPWGVVRGTNGDYYGATQNGGTHHAGTIFKVTPSGTLTTLHNFDVADGGFARAALIQGTDGDFYGTTYYGGANDLGTVFKITPSGALTTLHGFEQTDGAHPEAGLLQGTDGNLYGTTEGGGTNDDGTVFKITLGGTFTMLHSFDGTDGVYPDAGLVQATDGNFYGTTYAGGGNVGCNLVTCGTIYKITPSGTLTTLHSFDYTDGYDPYAGLVQATDGTFYGTTLYGGTDVFAGTLFTLSVGLKPFVETLPTSGAVGATVKILGTNLTGATNVTFNGTAAVFNVISHSAITTTVPAGATSGKVEVTDPTTVISSNLPFTVLP